MVDFVLRYPMGRIRDEGIHEHMRGRIGGQEWFAW